MVVKDLLENFNSVDAIRIASKKDLMKVKGLGATTANDIYNFFNND